MEVEYQIEENTGVRIFFKQETKEDDIKEIKKEDDAMEIKKEDDAMEIKKEDDAIKIKKEDDAKEMENVLCFPESITLSDGRMFKVKMKSESHSQEDPTLKTEAGEEENHEASHIEEQKKHSFTCYQCDYTSEDYLDMKIHHRSHKKRLKGAKGILEGAPDLHAREKSDFSNVYICFTCGYKAKNQAELKEHKDSEHSVVSVSCDQCEYIATTNHCLKRHKESKHTEYYCNFCDYVTFSFGRYKTHVQDRHEEPRYSCDQCNYKTPYTTSLRKHKLRKHTQYPCDHCNYILTSEDDLMRHKNKVHGNIFSCDQCDYIAETSTDLELHKQETSVHQHSCDQCGKVFRTLERLNTHKDNLHRLHPCKDCNHVAESRDRLKHHKAIVHDTIRYRCDQCEYYTYRISHLRAHVRTKHEVGRREEDVNG